MNNLISVIIINYKKEELTLKAINTLKQYEDYPFEIIYIDNENYSEELSRSDKLFELFGIPFTYISNKENIGFVNAVNQGLKVAEGKYILLWNNDAECHEPFMKSYVESYTNKVGLIGPSILATEGTLFIEGSCLFFTKEFQEKILGDMDEDFGIGVFDDVLWAHKTIKSGYKLLHKPFKFYHPASITFGMEAKIKQTEINRPIYREKVFSKSNNKPTIVHFCNQCHTGGIEQVQLTLQKNLKEKYNNYFLSVSEDNMADELRNEGCVVLSQPLEVNSQFCELLDPDIIMFHTAGYIPKEADMLQNTRAKKVIVCHSPGRMNGLPKYIECSLSVSKAVMDKQFYYNKTMILNGVDNDKIKRVDSSDLRLELGIKENEIVIGRLSRIAPDKGVTDFIMMAQRVLHDCDNVKFMVIGEHKESLHNGYTDKMKKMTKQLGIYDKFIWTGIQRDLSKYLSCIDIMAEFVKNQGFGLVYGEGMCAKLPIVTYNDTANPESVKDGYNGFLVETGNIGEASEKVKELVIDDKKRKQMSESAYKFVTKNLSGKRMAEDYDKFYQFLLNKENING